MHSFRSCPHFAWLALAAIACGCGSASDLAPVRGSVEYDGQPLTSFDNAAVVFTPAAGRLATGVINKDGSFELTTSGSGDGAAVGTAKVSVSATMNAPAGRFADRHAGVRWLIPASFADPDASGLACEVEPGEENVFRILLTSDGAGSIERQ